MKKRRLSFVRLSLVVFFIVAIISFMPLISGEYIVKNSTGGGGFNHSLGSVELYNFSLNNTFTDPGSNVTKISIKLLSGIDYISGEGSSTSYENFSNTTSEDIDNLSWNAPTGEALVMNNSKEYFWFEANSTSSDGGDMEIEVKNSTGSSFKFLDINIYSQESSGSLDINVVSPLDGEYFDQSIVRINATANDTVSSWKVNFNGTNYTGINESFSIDDGKYDLVVYAKKEGGVFYKNDSVSFSVDTTIPNVSIVSPTQSVYNRNDIWFNFSSNEDIEEWIINHNGTLGENKTFSGDGDSFSEKINVSRGEWDLHVYAKDFAGNTGFESSFFSVNSTISEDTEDTNDDSSDDGFWTKNYSETDEDLSERGEVVKDCGVGERIGVKVKENIYYIGVVEIRDSEAVMNISDEEGNVIIQTTQEIGERIEHDLEGDEMEEILLVINGVSGDKATLTVKASYYLEDQPEENQTSLQDFNESGDEDTEEGSNKAAQIFIIVVGGIFVISLIGILYYVQKHQKESAEKRFKEQTTIYEDTQNLVSPR